MSYVFGSGVPYGQYLQAQALVDDVKGALAIERKNVSLTVQSGTRELIASQAALHDQGVHLETVVSAGFDQLSWDIRELRGAVQDLNATFEWGFHAILCHTGRMADALEELRAAAKTPTKTTAYEYFDDARTAFGRGHHRDALELIDKAISGDHTSAGYKLDWRFHLLKGSILVGTADHPELLDLTAAEQTYRTAAEYAETDDRKGASLALLGASWACYCQGKLDEALALARRALRFSPSFGEALFQSAKVLMAMSRPDEALPLLAAALEEDPYYLLKASGDVDFQAHSVLFEAWLTAHRDKKERELKALYSELSEDGRFWLRCLEMHLDLQALERTLLSTKSGLFDHLCVLRTLRSVVPTKATGPYTSMEALKVVKAVPVRLQLPRRLLANFVTDSPCWGHDESFFDLTDALLARDESEVVQAIYRNQPPLPDTRLEFFAAWMNALPRDSSAKVALKAKLGQMSADSRRLLIAQFEEVSQSSRYSRQSIESTRAALLERWDQWRPAILRELNEAAFARNESPLKGVVGRFFGSALGFFALVAFVEAITDGWVGRKAPILLWLLWAGGLTAVVFIPIAIRIIIRNEELRKEHQKERALFDRLKRVGAG